MPRASSSSCQSRAGLANGGLTDRQGSSFETFRTAGRGEQCIQNRPCAVSGAGDLKHIADARILDIGNLQIEIVSGTGLAGADRSYG